MGGCVVQALHGRRRWGTAYGGGGGPGVGVSKLLLLWFCERSELGGDVAVWVE